MKIIIVDDEKGAFNNFFDEIVEEWDFDYKFFKDNKDLILNYVKSNTIDCAFVDINMPNINGKDLARELIKVNSKIKIVFITGLSITKEEIDEDIKKNVIDIINKPYTGKELGKIISILKNGKQILDVKMFGGFDCFINGKIVKFTSSKSKELFALLLAYNGKSLVMSDAISQLWPDVELSRSKVLYRDAVWRLRSALKEIEFECVDFQRATLVLNKDNIKCDYYDYLDGKFIAGPKDFLKNYDWSLYYLGIEE